MLPNIDNTIPQVQSPTAHVVVWASILSCLADSCCPTNAPFMRKYPCQGHIINLKMPPSSLASQPHTGTSPSIMTFKHSKDLTVMNSFFHEIHGSATMHHHHTLGEFRTCLLPAMLTYLNVMIRRTSYNHKQCKLIDKWFSFFPHVKITPVMRFRTPASSKLCCCWHNA